LGDERSGDNDAIKSRVIPVIQAVLTKTVQSRIEEVVLYGTRGKTGFNVTAKDPTMSSWRKKPRKVMLDSASRNVTSAKRMAWEEIYEGKVGSVELKITIPDPGFPIQQNQDARLFLKEIDMYGHYFVVGVRIQGGPDGFVQEVRLRELEFALSKRVPTAPKLDSGQPAPGAGSALGNGLEQAAGIPTGWGDYFVKAAKKHHGVMNYQLFLACLLGICRIETDFVNEREDGGPGGDHHIWHPFKPSHTAPISTGPVPPGVDPSPVPPPDYTIANDKRAWQQKFANEPGVFGITRQFGVGPMQLTSIGLKHEADDLLHLGHRNQFAGGRWHPEHNIMIAAKSLATCVQGVHAARDQDIWLAVDAYNRGISGALSYFATYGHVSIYAAKVRGYVMKDPGYLAIIQSAVTTADTSASKGRFVNPFPVGWQPNRLDMGYDGTFKRKIGAPFDGRIHFAGVLKGNWRGSRGVIIKANQGIGNGVPTDTLYFAEGITPTVKAGDRVKAGQTIATPSVNPYNGVIGNIEFGVCAQGPVGEQTDPYAETGISNRREMVLRFADWAHRVLGVAKPSSTSDAGYP
jgi:murein DD-endopeptidase MepM/ murein hydrolase activator NlpD